MANDGSVIDLNDFSNDLLNSYERLKKADNIYIWISIGLSDQIIILFVTYLLKLIDARLDNVKLIQFVKSKNHKSNYRGIGEILPVEILKHPDPISLSEKDL